MPPSILDADKSRVTDLANELPQDIEGLGGDPSAARRQVGSGSNLEAILDIPVSVKVVLGTATMPVAQLARLGRGAVVPLDRRVGEPVDIVVNGKIIARGEVVVLKEGTPRFGISLTEVVGSQGSKRPDAAEKRA